MKNRIKAFLLVLVICGIAHADYPPKREIQNPNDIENSTEAEKQADARFEFVKADKYFVPPADDVVAILLYICGDCKDCPTDCEFSQVIVLFGNKEEAEKVVGKSLEPWKVVEGREWLDKIIDEYKEALKEAGNSSSGRWCPGESIIVFVTKDKGYTRCLSYDEVVVYDEYMESMLLWDYMKELGFIPGTFTVSPCKADEYYIPPKDEIEAIVVYRYQRFISIRCPIAIFGDKELAQKLLYGDKELLEKVLSDEIISREEGLDESFPNKTIEPKMVFEGRGWLEKIMDAYEAAIEKAKQEEKKEFRGLSQSENDGSIVFVTKHEAYERKIRIGESTIYDDDVDSEELKTYFDEFGLVDELLAGKPPREFEVFMAGNHYVPPTDETVAVLLYSYKLDPNGGRILLALFGDKEETENVMGKSLTPKRVIAGRDWLEKLVDEYRTAIDKAEGEEYEGGGYAGFIYFITDEKAYFRIICVSENTIFDNYMHSSQLKSCFDELGLTEEVMDGRLPQENPTPVHKKCKIIRPYGRFIPPMDETKAILLYPRNAYSDKPLALFSDDKELTERILDRTLQPKKIIEERDWLEKIMSAYEDAFKKGKEEGYYCRYKDSNGDIWFVTAEKGYIREICVDANSIYEQYMESGLLKKYFDELGLTKELLAGEPNQADHD